MASKTAEQLPWCTIFLVAVVMISHTLVLMGNLDTARSIGLVGHSSKGWADVGIDMARTFSEEIDYVMSNMTQGLTQAINTTLQLEEMLDIVISQMGEHTEKALVQVSTSLLQQDPGEADASSGNSSIANAANEAMEQIDNLPLPLPPMMKNVAKVVIGALAAAGDAGGDDPLAVARSVIVLLLDAMMIQVQEVLDTFLDILEPVLVQVGKWYTTFGDKIQAGIEQFSTAVDGIEKLLDQIMAQAGAGGEQAEEMEYNTYNLFAVSDSEVGITVQDLKDVSAIYSITAIQGSKAEDVHGRYDVNKDAVIDKQEFSELVVDPSLPGVMAVVLRSYAKRLSQVSGMVGGAKMRDEVANAVVQYLQLVCAKNYTKVEWIADRLTNHSLPVQFTAAVMRNLALLADDPEVLTTADVGSMVVSAMTAANPSSTTEAADLMADTEWWTSEGFDPSEQPTCVDRVTRWTTATLIQIRHDDPARAGEELRRLHEVMSSGIVEAEPMSLIEGVASEVIEAFGSLARRRAEENRRQFYQAQHQQLLHRHQELTRSVYSRTYFNALFGGRMASHLDPVAASSVNSGTPAVPETLEFARYLAWNATSSAQEFQSLCFNYSGMSSTPADAFATQIEAMVKKTQGFMSMLDDYAGEDGMDRLRNKTHSFIDQGKEALADLIIGQFNKSLGLMQQAKEQPRHEIMALVQLGPAQPPGLAPGSDVWMQMLDMLEQLQAVLPPCIENLKTARKEVSKVAETMDSVFDTFEKQGPPIFEKIARYYKLAFIGYFLFMIIFPLSVLYYGLYSAGYWGGPKADEVVEEDYQEPQGCWQRLCTCCECCCTCLRDCWRGECCFWSFLILGQIFVLVLFLLALTFCILAGVEMFLASGCAAIYLLGDDKACSETLRMVQKWVTTFNAGSPQFDIGEVCGQKSLTTCRLIEKDMKEAAMFTAVGAIVAAVFSFQLLIECCIIHERIRMRRLIDGLVKQKGATAAGSA